MVSLSRRRILAGGQILEDIDLYSRVHETFNHFTTEGSGYNDYAEGFGNVWESCGVYASRARNLDGIVNNGNAVSINQIPGTFGTSFQTVICKPLSGFVNQQKYLSLRFMPITIELSLVDDPLERIAF